MKRRCVQPDFILLALMTALVFLCGCAQRGMSTAEREAQSAPAKAEQDAADFRANWDTVAAVLRGENAVVETWTEQAPYTMRILLPGTTSEYEARKLANTTRERLGEKAVVYIYDDTRKQLAKASPWGTE